MTPDAQEALSRKYSARAIRLMKLESGTIAIFDNRYALLALVPDLAAAQPFLDQAAVAPLPTYVPPPASVLSTLSGVPDLELRI